MKKQFRLSLFAHANLAAETIVLNAARSNSGYIPLTLQQLVDIGKQVAILTPDHHKGTSFEVVGENTLHIDTLVNGNYETVCIIEEIKVFEVYAKNDDERVNVLAASRY